jgi:dTDP-4-dehydrorhamnose 3,5-epimerase
MEFRRIDIPDLVLVTPRVFGDGRGYFAETFRKDRFAAHVGEIDFIQDNESKSAYGVLRGLHYQLPPFSQSKLVRVVAGRILDVALDIRQNSPTFGHHACMELSEENHRQLFIPKGFAHGFAVLSREAVVTYKVDAPYAPECERGIFYADPILGIDWRLPSGDIRLSDKDRSLPLLKDASRFEIDLDGERNA